MLSSGSGRCVGDVVLAPLVAVIVEPQVDDMKSSNSIARFIKDNGIYDPNFNSDPREV